MINYVKNTFERSWEAATIEKTHVRRLKRIYCTEQRKNNRSGATEITDRPREKALFKATVMYSKETISPGRRLTKESDSLPGPVLFTQDQHYTVQLDPSV